MKIFQKIGFIWTLLIGFICAVLLSVSFSYIMPPLANCRTGLDKLNSYITDYIKANKGCFPNSEADLEGQGFIRRINSNTVEYAFRDHLERIHWYKFYSFDVFKISYGAKLCNIEMVKGKLYDKLLKKETLLIDGPYKLLFKNKYESISLHLYELMLKEKKAKEQEEPLNNIE